MFRPDIITAVATVLAALISAIVAWRLGSSKGKTDAQGAITAGFTSLVDALQEERTETAATLKAQRDEYLADTARLRDNLARFAAKIGSLELEVKMLRQALAARGIEPPIDSEWIG